MASRSQNLAKFLYDIAKLIFGGFVVATILTKGPATFLALFGIITTALVAIIAFWIDKGE
jgi:acyl-CoA synthetase (AMP-forming)/AMP-acid ligase II